MSERFRAARDALLGTWATMSGRAPPSPGRRSTSSTGRSTGSIGSPPRERIALHVVAEGGGEARLTLGELSAESDRDANGLRALGVARGDRLLLMLGNVPELWVMMLAAMKLGAVLIPASTLLTPADLADRLERGRVAAVVCEPGLCDRFAGLGFAGVRVAVGDPPPGWRAYADLAAAPGGFAPDGPTMAADPPLLYFTSGTTQLPKLVEHTHASYPVGHLTTMYWLGLRPGDVHLNISSPGWAKHAWSCLLRSVERRGDGLHPHPAAVRRRAAARGAGRPRGDLAVERAWGITIRDGYGQTETTLQVGNFTGAEVRPGSMGRPAPGYPIVLMEPGGGRVPGVGEGEVCIDLARRPLGLMTGYRDSAELTAEAMRGGVYHTGDVARRDADGYLTFVGRADDVFKASDYRISPFELESVLIEHPAVAEAAVVPSPDPVRLAVPKAFVTLAPGHLADEPPARAILQFTRARLALYKRIRRIELAELPKTISGKIRRVELRRAEQGRAPGARNPGVVGGGPGLTARRAAAAIGAGSPGHERARAAARRAGSGSGAGRSERRGPLLD